MKLSQIAIAVITTSFATFAWTFIFWEFFNPLKLVYQSGSILTDIDSLLSEIGVGSYILGSQSAPDLQGLLIVNSIDSNLVSIAIKSLSACFITSLLASSFVVVSNLHRSPGSKRFLSLIMVGALFILQSALPLIHNNQLIWKLILVDLVYNSVFWIIIAISLTIQLAIKKRNIFLEK